MTSLQCIYYLSQVEAFILPHQTYSPRFSFSKYRILYSYYHNSSFSPNCSPRKSILLVEKVFLFWVHVELCSLVCKYLFHFNISSICDHRRGYGWCNYVKVTFFNPIRLQLIDVENQMVRSHVLWQLQFASDILNLLKYLEWPFKSSQKSIEDVTWCLELLYTHIKKY